MVYISHLAAGASEDIIPIWSPPHPLLYKVGDHKAPKHRKVHATDEQAFPTLWGVPRWNQAMRTQH